MSDAREDPRTVTIDREGLLVVPMAILKEAGISPGDPLRIRFHDGRIEIEPATALFRTVERHGFPVAEAVEPLPALTNSEVRRMTRALRERQVR